MNLTPLFPAAIDAVTAHFDSLGADEALRMKGRERDGLTRVWKLTRTPSVLNGGSPTIILPHDFPLSPARVQVDADLCLLLPHVEENGNVCLGVLGDPDDLQEPVKAVQNVLRTFGDLLVKCEDPGWVESEFHKERQSYWARHASAARPPKGYATRELLLDVDPGVTAVQEARAISLRDQLRAVATTAAGGPEALARLRAWDVGTIMGGAALVAGLPVGEWWTPRTWPKTFDQLNELISQLSNQAGRLSAWYSSRKWPTRAAVFVVLVQGPATFGWRIIPPGLFYGRSKPWLVPIEVKRVDRQWALSRDHEPDRLATLSAKKVVVFGCGSLGSPVIELLARAGVGQIEVVDPEPLEPENVARHTLGLSEILLGKAASVSAHNLRDVPGIRVIACSKRASEWLGSIQQVPDLLVDCTGEREVRLALSALRTGVLQQAPAIMAWAEPFGAAGHVVVISKDDSWPSSDPAETAINYAAWPDDITIAIPGCGRGFHAYGMADVYRLAGLVAERVIAVLSGADADSAVWSFVRNRSFFERVCPNVSFNQDVPASGVTESVTVRRDFKEALGAG